MENGNVKQWVFVLMVSIITGVVGGALLWIRNDMSKMDNRIWEMQENIAKIPSIEEKLKDITDKVNEGRKRTGDSSFNLFDLVGIKK